MTHTIHQGDVLAILKTLPSNHFDACLSDPPYGLNFMGKEWDKGVPSTEVYTELLRVMKPGALGLHFGGTRTYHRLACNIEDAGFEIRDCIAWLYGSGFPKSHNISKALDKVVGATPHDLGAHPTIQGKGLDNFFGGGFSPEGPRITAPASELAKQWDGYGTALKPAYEPCVVVQKPFKCTNAQNVVANGCGALNIDGSRVGESGGTQKGTNIGIKGAGLYEGGLTSGACDIVQLNSGRFPANLILDEVSAEALDATQSVKEGPSRFFYTAKVSSKERNAGLEKNTHPTLKPISLTTYLAGLVLPPLRTDGSPRRILVPFSGAGSEMIGCLLAGWDDVTGIELDTNYIEIAQARIAHHTESTNAKFPQTIA